MEPFQHSNDPPPAHLAGFDMADAAGHANMIAVDIAVPAADPRNNLGHAAAAFDSVAARHYVDYWPDCFHHGDHAAAAASFDSVADPRNNLGQAAAAFASAAARHYVDY